MDDKLKGNYNMLICSGCGAAASIIFEHLLNGNCCTWLPFSVKNIEKEILFMGRKELLFGISKLIDKGYLSGDVNEKMYISNKMLLFLPNKEN